MTTRNAEEAKKRHDVIKEIYKVRFEDNIEPELWPKQHQVTFRHITRLGRRVFGTWRSDVIANWRERPWRLNLKQRAEEIVARARVCQKSESNEAEWRSQLEHKIFERMDKEMTCRQCGARLWKSEIKAIADPGEEFTDLLNDRISKERCNCPTEGPYAQGLSLNHLFACRIEAKVDHDMAAKSKLNKQSADSNGDQTLEKRFTPTLWPNDKTPIVFPFLVLESKRAESSSFERINSQIGISTPKSLAIQKKLQAAAAASSDFKWVAGPLCWCLSHIGGQWRVAAGYASRKKQYDWEVATLWKGDITTDDGALQLLLIIDYICDWAREVHREAMIRQLSKLAAPVSDDLSELDSFERLSVGSIHGMREANNNITHPGHRNQQPQMEFATSLRRIGSWKPESNNTPLQADPFREFDSAAGVVRDSKFIHSRVIGLCISLSNFELLENCKDSDKESMNLLKTIVRRLETEEPLFMDYSTLYDMEHAWTGVNRNNRDQTDAPDFFHEGVFHVLVTFSAYVTSEWELTRELCYLAISEPAKDLLFRKTREVRRRSSRGFTCPLYEDVGNIRPEAIAEYTKQLLGATAQQTLTACLYCSSFCPSVQRISEDDSDIDLPPALYEDAGVRYSLEPRPKKASRDIVWSLYRKHRVGRNEPGIAFLNVSKRLDELNIPTSKGRGRSSPWPSYNKAPGELAVLAVAQSKLAVLVSAPSIDGPSLANITENCIFVMDRVKVTQLLPLLRAQGRRFHYRFAITRLCAKFAPEVSWNNTHSIRKGGSSQIGEDILAYVEQALTMNSALRRKGARGNDEDRSYQSDIDSDSEDSTSEYEESESEEDDSDHDEENESSTDESEESSDDDEDEDDSDDDEDNDSDD
ncbi:hypothetical protein B7463_g9352, partial [Scytalidium lignicola]